MKSFLLSLLFSALLLSSFTGQTQVTKLSNNTNLETAIPLENFAVLISEADSLWRTDGTPGGTFKYATNVSVANQFDYAILGNKIYFSGVDANGTELWVTDGTAPGTQMVKDINTSGDGGPKYFHLLNNAIYFFADNGTNDYELWKTDGTPGGTSMVKDINTSGSSIPSYEAVPGFPTEVAVNYFDKNNVLYFTANDGTNGVELWQSDGTPGGTNMVININPGPSSSFPQGFYAYGSSFLFSAYRDADGNELWKTDGTAGGTTLVKDIDPTNQIFPPFLPTKFGYTTFNNKVYFNATDGTNGYEGWVTDGTPTGTTLLKDFYADEENGLPSFADALFINNQMIFPATSEDEGSELWQSDGTPGGTSLFKDINTGPDGSDPFIILNGFGATDINSFHSNLFNGFLFLSATTPDGGRELWKTDGTSGGTVRVKDINPGPDSSMEVSNFDFNLYTSNQFFFTATDGSTGYELWKSDGSEANTTQVIDIFPAADSSSFPQLVGTFNGIVLFTAHDGDNPNDNRDLFRLDGTFQPLPLKLVQFSGAVRDRSVGLNWATAQEINTDYFEVERSTNGSQFEAVGRLAASKNSNTKKNYRFDDINALASNSKVYYRLKMVDADGKFTHSKTIAFSKVSEGRLVTYPNPVTDELKIIINTGNRKQLSLAIFDQSGKQVYSQQLSARQGANSYEINVSSFAKGSYYVNVVTDGGIETTKFVKK